VKHIVKIEIPCIKDYSMQLNVSLIKAFKLIITKQTIFLNEFLHSLKKLTNFIIYRFDSIFVDL
jgi:hypothetical protein